MEKIDENKLITECKKCNHKNLYYCADCIYDLHDNSYSQLVKNKNKFELSDLKSGMVIHLRAGIKYLVVDDLLINRTSCISINDFNQDLTHKRHKYFDIKFVFEKSDNWENGFQDGLKYGKTIWERK